MTIGNPKRIFRNSLPDSQKRNHALFRCRHVATKKIRFTQANSPKCSGVASFLLALEKPSLPRSCPAIRSVAGPTGAQRVAYPLSGSTGIECVKSTWPIAPPLRLVLCVVLRLAEDPGGLLPRRHLRRFSGIFPHVADREPLGLDLLLHFLLSHLEYIRFRPTRRSFLMANCSPRYLTPQAWPQLARLAAPSALLQRLPCQLIRSNPVNIASVSLLVVKGHPRCLGDV